MTSMSISAVMGGSRSPPGRRGCQAPTSRTLLGKLVGERADAHVRAPACSHTYVHGYMDTGGYSSTSGIADTGYTWILEYPHTHVSAHSATSSIHKYPQVSGYGEEGGGRASTRAASRRRCSRSSSRAPCGRASASSSTRAVTRRRGTGTSSRPWRAPRGRRTRQRKDASFAGPSSASGRQPPRRSRAR